MESYALSAEHFAAADDSQHDFSMGRLHEVAAQAFLRFDAYWQEQQQQVAEGEREEKKGPAQEEAEEETVETSSANETPPDASSSTAREPTDTDTVAPIALELRCACPASSVGLRSGRCP